MKILQISSTDLIGQRFNGQYALKYFNLRGHPSNQLVWNKEGHGSNTYQMLQYPGVRRLQRYAAKVEDILSIRGLIHPSSFLLSREKQFKESDVVHYQLIHWPNYFSNLALPSLTRQKPSVWTIHDFHPMSGHCVSPFDCNRWSTGCGQCPYLSTDFKMRTDRTALMWKIKKQIYKKSHFSIVAASQFMKKKIEQSPLLNRFPIYHVPFGLDMQEFTPGNTAYSKKLLGIEPDEIVICFRAAPGEYKGLDYIKKALSHIQTDKKICLLTFNVQWQLEEFRRHYKIVDLGWVLDDALTKHAFSASDFFLMPSMQETFGMMAVEAMAFGKPVVVFEGTALPEVVGGNDVSFVLPKGVDGLARVIKELIENPGLRFQRGQMAREFAVKNYDLNLHIERLLKVYSQTISDFGKK